MSRRYKVDHRGVRLAIRQAQQAVAAEADESIMGKAYTAHELRAMARQRSIGEPEAYRSAYVEAFVQAWLARETTTLTSIAP